MTDLHQLAKTGAGLSLRPEEPCDREFLARLYASTRKDELLLTGWSSEQKADFCAQQFRAQTIHYDRFYAQVTRNIVLVDAAEAGRLYLFRNEADLRIVDISLLPQYRGQGVGTALIRSVIEEAASNGCFVSLHVDMFNPARRLYERLGFRQVSNDGVCLLMHRAGSPALT